MGLLDKVEKDKLKKKTKEVPKVEYAVIKKHVEKHIKEQENKNVKKPTVHFVNNRVETHRPEGTLERLKEQVPRKQANKKGIDFSEIKAEIEAELKGKRGEEETQPKVYKNRVPTGIPGLDEVMSGGFRRNTAILVVGGAGSGKTIFAMQSLVNGIDMCNESGVYISFEQTEKEILEDMKDFNWNLEDKIKKKKLVILNYTPEQVEKVLKAGGGTARDVIESIKAKRVFIDSLTAFTLLHDNALAQRKACISLFKAIKKWNCTALLLAEYEQSPDAHKSTIEEFEVDGVIILYNIRTGDARQRALEIFKMRGMQHSAKIFPMAISNEGIKIYPKETVF